jgi:hypothetical protein
VEVLLGPLSETNIDGHPRWKLFSQIQRKHAKSTFTPSITERTIVLVLLLGTVFFCFLLISSNVTLFLSLQPSYSQINYYHARHSFF